MFRWVLGVAVVGVLMATASAGAAALIDSGDVKNGSLTGKDVKNRSLTKKDFRGSVRGPRGFTGLQGPQGPPGPTVVNRIGTYIGSLSVPPGDIEIVTVACPAGQAVVSALSADFVSRTVA
jgi:hypothetical protein